MMINNIILISIYFSVYTMCDSISHNTTSVVSPILSARWGNGKIVAGGQCLNCGAKAIDGTMHCWVCS